MPSLPIPTLVAQSVSALYNPCKDLFLYLKRQKKDIEELEDRMRNVVIVLNSILSRKQQTDQSLRNSATAKKSAEYSVMETDFAGVLKLCTKFISKYAKMTGNVTAPTTELDTFNANIMIKNLEEIESKICTLNFFSLAKLSRDIARLSIRAAKILDRLKPEYMMHTEAEPYQENLPDGTDLPMFGKYVDEVLSCLSESGNRVGVVGPVGVGKSIVMKKLCKRLFCTKSLPDGSGNNTRLDNIIWIQDFPVHETKQKLQDEIMLQLQISREKTNSTNVNAILISKFLREKKYILLMDHVSENFDLSDVGLHEDHKYGNVVIASSDKKAISRMVKDEVEIRRLTKEDAWELFENIHGIIYDLRLKGIADRIIECCGGLQKQIIFVAASLRRRPDESSWMDAKRNLQSHSKSVKLMDLGGIDFFYKKRYDDMETYYKKCFLYTALFPNEHLIHKDYLIECWMAERFIDEDDAQKLRRTRDSGQTVLDQLTDMYLLDWSLDKKYVKMPFVSRRVALEIEYPGEDNCSIWVPADGGKPNEGTWRTVRRMSLIRCSAELPPSPVCSNISTLLLQSKPELKNLGDLFFSRMCVHLQVLDLYNTEIQVLPSSTGELKNLKSLYLNSCKHLQMLPPQAAALKKLEFLDICGTSIPSLPRVIEKMVALRCLRASFSTPGGKEVKEAEIIILLKNLKKLEELSIDTGLYSPPSDMAAELAMEIASLEHLTTLRFNFPSVSSFTTFVTHSKSLKNTETSWELSTFRSFKIFIGCHGTQHPYESDVSKKLAERRLRFAVNEEFSSPCRELLKQACALEWIGDQSVDTLSRFNLHSLQVCIVESCNQLKSIVDADAAIKSCSEGVLQNLQKLHLYDLQLLECVWKGPVMKRSLINLTVLTVNGCNRLTNILDPELACTLRNLQHLKVDNCCEVSVIVQVPTGSSNAVAEDQSDVLNSVRVIELSNLPKLRSISGGTLISWISLDSMVIIRCSQLSGLSLTQTNAKKLASIKCENSWWDQLPLPDGVKQRFHPSFLEKRRATECQL